MRIHVIEAGLVKLDVLDGTGKLRQRPDGGDLLRLLTAKFVSRLADAAPAGGEPRGLGRGLRAQPKLDTQGKARRPAQIRHRAVRNLPSTVHDDDTIDPAFEFGQRVGREKDAGALLSQFAKNVIEALPQGRIEA